MLKAIHAQEDREAARAKARDVVAKLREMKLPAAAKKVEDSVDETLEYMAFPREHWRKIRSNNAIERLNREIRRRTRVVGTFPDGHSALMLVCAQLQYMENSMWGSKLYMNMEHLETHASRDKRRARGLKSHRVQGAAPLRGRFPEYYKVRQMFERSLTVPRGIPSTNTCKT
jgi:putative transposase